MNEKVKKVLAFLTNDVWQIQVNELSRWRKMLYKLIRICIVSYERYVEIRSDLRASALTYYTLLSIVPVFAVLFGIAKGFGIQNAIADDLQSAFPGQEVVIGQITEISFKLIDNTSGGVVAGFGLLFLFWSVVKVMNSIEESFNDIWDIADSRSWIRKFSDYFSIILIGPFLLLLTGAVNVFIRTRLSDIFNLIGFTGPLASLTDLLLDLVPIAMLGFMFSLFYVIVPNTKVNFKSALYAGLIVGVVFNFIQILYIEFQVGVSRANAIYGSLAALPLFFIWMQLSWRIVNLGAVISYSHQNMGRFINKIRERKLKPVEVKIMAVKIVQIILKGQVDEREPLNSAQISEKLEHPHGIIKQGLDALLDSGLVYRVIQDNRGVYIPALESSKYRILEIINRLDMRNIDTLNELFSSNGFDSIKHHVVAYSESLKKNENNKHILEI